jgi:hypothetical protein
LERPVANESEPLEVKFGLTLQQIIDVVSWCFCVLLGYQIVLLLSVPVRISAINACHFYYRQ